MTSNSQRTTVENPDGPTEQSPSVVQSPAGPSSSPRSKVDGSYGCLAAIAAFFLLAFYGWYSGGWERGYQRDSESRSQRDLEAYRRFESLSSHSQSSLPVPTRRPPKQGDLNLGGMRFDRKNNVTHLRDDETGQWFELSHEESKIFTKRYREVVRKVGRPEGYNP
jgi:hypothetical protein